MPKNRKIQHKPTKSRADYIDFDYFIRDFCDNLNQLVELKKNEKLVGSKLKSINGFNERIGNILLENDVARQYYEIAATKEVILQEMQTLNQNKISQMRKLKKFNFHKSGSQIIQYNQEINDEFLKKLHYYSNNLSDYLRTKIKESEKNEQVKLRYEQDFVANLLQKLAFTYTNKTKLKNLMEIKEGRVLPSVILNNNRLLQQIDTSEKQFGRFAHISSLSRIKSQNINNIMEAYQSQD